MPAGATISLDVRLESVSEGVYVSGSVAAPLQGECARCLDELTDELSVEIGELFAYPDSVTDETTDDDELPRVVDDHVDVEQTVRDAVVLALPLAPLCADDCPGLCPDCGGRRADLGPDHGHETLDPRWAALREQSRPVLSGTPDSNYRKEIHRGRSQAPDVAVEHALPPGAVEGCRSRPGDLREPRLPREEAAAHRLPDVRHIRRRQVVSPA